MIRDVLIHDHCNMCQENTDQELNTVACMTECLMCGHEEKVSEEYVRRQLEEW